MVKVLLMIMMEMKMMETLMKMVDDDDDDDDHGLQAVLLSAVFAFWGTLSLTVRLRKSRKVAFR